jgi:hypothetical protein
MHARHKQRGVILLTVMLLILVAGSFVMLKALNIAADRRADDPDAATHLALKQAKQALIAYAVNTPALTPSGLGPGRLPCPDLNGDGSSAGTCSLGGTNAMTGRLPYRELMIDEIVDGSGTPLWYSLDEAYRYHLANAVINSDTPNVLNVDAQSDIVAVVIAPGAVVGTQDRDNAPDITDFLEGENTTVNDAEFTFADPGMTFNDTVITVTRAEMMAAVERRVLAEATNALNAYYNLYGGYPWASPFQNPATSNFIPNLGSDKGHLPLHVDNAGVDDFFAAPFTLAWNVPDDGVLSTGAAPRDACVRSNQCNDEDIEIDHDFTGSTVTFVTGACAWTNAETFNCGGIERVTLSVAGGTLERTYAVDMEIVGVSPIVTGPTSTLARSRALNLTNGALPDGSRVTLTVFDKLNGVARGPARSLNLAPGDVMASLAVTGVPFFLGDDSSEVAATSSPASLPRWFTENNWHHYVYYAFAANEAVGGVGCTPGTNCLTVNWDRTGTLTDQTIDKARGVALIAGLDRSTARPTGMLDDYFEGENATVDNTYARAAVSANANDQLRILDPNE